MADAIHSIAGRLGASGHHPMSVWGDALERKAETDNAGHYGGEIAVRRGAHSIAHNLDLIQDWLSRRSNGLRKSTPAVSTAETRSNSCVYRPSFGEPAGRMVDFSRYSNIVSRDSTSGTLWVERKSSNPPGP